MALNINENSTDEGHSPETSGHLLRFWHFQQHSQLLFSYCSSKCHAAYEVFNFFHFLIPDYVMNVTGVYHGDVILRQITESIKIRREGSINNKTEWNSITLPQAAIVK